MSSPSSKGDQILERQKTYGYEDRTGWRRYRALQPFRGIYHDIRRRLPYLKSDITDGFNYRTFAGTVRIFFVK